MTAEIHLGTQGWNYDAWVGPFYPVGTRPSEFLTVYARAFDSVEVDSTFYASPAEATIRSWAERTPKGFIFSLKLPQEITHEHRLRDLTGASASFFDRVLALLREHNIALALVDGRWIPRKLMLSLATKPTADFAYIRWMGPNRDLVDYTRVQVDRSYEIEAWGDAIAELTEKVTQVYGYVANTFSGHAPATVRELQYKVGQTPVDPDLLGEQMSL